MLRRNLELKLAALILAVSLWMYVTISTYAITDDFRVNVEPPEVPAGLVLTSPLGETTISLQGTQEALDNAEGHLQARAKVLNPRAGNVRARIEPIYPPELTLVKVTPEEMTLVLEKIVTTSFPISYEFQGEPIPGYILGEPQISPKTAKVTGLESLVADVNRIVVSIDPSGAVLEHPQWSSLTAVDAAGLAITKLKVEPQSAIVRIPVTHTTASKMLPVFLPLRGNVAEGYKLDRITIEPEMVTVAGDAAAIKSLENISVLPLSIDGVRSSFSRRLKLIVPERVASVSEKSVLVRVRVSAAPPPEPSAEPPADEGRATEGE